MADPQSHTELVAHHDLLIECDGERLQPDIALRAGDILRVGHGQATLRIDNADFLLASDTALRLGPAEEAHDLLVGGLTCTADPRSDGVGLKVRSAHAEARVFGTAFRLWSDGRQTSLAVDEGQVGFGSTASDHRDPLAAGSWARIQRDGGMSAFTTTPHAVQTVFTEDWSQGLTSWLALERDFVTDHAQPATIARAQELVAVRPRHDGGFACHLQTPTGNSLGGIAPRGPGGGVLAWPVKPGRIVMSFDWYLEPGSEPVTRPGVSVNTWERPEAIRTLQAATTVQPTGRWQQVTMSLNIRTDGEGYLATLDMAPNFGRMSMHLAGGDCYLILTGMAASQRFGAITISSDIAPRSRPLPDMP